MRRRRLLGIVSCAGGSEVICCGGRSRILFMCEMYFEGQLGGPP
jgi:hypothetical protein